MKEVAEVKGRNKEKQKGELKGERGGQVSKEKDEKMK